MKQCSLCNQDKAYLTTMGHCLDCYVRSCEQFSDGNGWQIIGFTLNIGYLNNRGVKETQLNPAIFIPTKG